MLINQKKYSFFMTLILMLKSPLLSANDMLFSGTLIDPAPCIINSGNTIDVPFGINMGVTKIDGVNYIQTVRYQVTCGAASAGLDLGLTITSASVTASDPSAIQTNLPNLGIRLLKNGVPLVLNARVTYDRNNPPVLQAVPIKVNGTTLDEGTFEATATLLVDYQ